MSAWRSFGQRAAETYPQFIVRSTFLFLRCLLLTGNGLTLALAGAAVGLGTLALYWQTFTMTQSAVTGDIQQTLDAHLHLRTQLSFHLELIGNGGADIVEVLVVPLVYFLVTVNPVLVQDIAGGGRSNTIDIGQTN